MDYDTFQDEYSYTSLGALHFKHHPADGEKLVFIHGFGASTLAWKKFMEFLPDNLDVYLVDLLGHGGSDSPDIDYTVSMQFQVLREFFSLRNSGDSYIFGHSYGGWVAAYYATQPYTCKGIILEDPAGLKEMFDKLHAAGRVEQEKERLFREAMKEAGNDEKVMKNMIDLSFEEDHLTTELLSKINRKTLIIWGSNDTMVPVEYAKVLQGHIRGSSLSIVQNAGHIPHYERPKEVADLLLKFIGYSRS